MTYYKGTKIKAVRGDSPHASALLFTVECSECGRRAYIYREMSDSTQMPYCSTYCNHISREDPVLPALMTMSLLGILTAHDFVPLGELFGW